MAQHIAEHHLEELEAKGRDLFELAASIAPQYTLLDPDASPEANEIALNVQALCLAINGLLTGAGLNEGQTIVGLGAACGAALGKCNADRRVLLSGFKDQFSRSLAEVTQAMEPQGTA